jgi:hypothetical protein
MLRTRASRIASLLPARAGVYAHRVRVLETGDRLERAEGQAPLQVHEHQPLRLDVEETCMPWAWLRIEAGSQAGEEHRVESDLMGFVRQGHELIVMSEDGTGRPLLIETLTTGQSFEDDEPHPLRRDGSPAAWVRMISCFAFLGVVILTIPLVFPWLWLSTTVAELFLGRVSDDLFETLLLFTPFAAGLVSALSAHVYDGWETRRRAERWRSVLRTRDAARPEMGKSTARTSRDQTIIGGDSNRSGLAPHGAA